MVQNVSGTTKDIGGTHFLHIAMFDVEEILNPQTSFDIMGYLLGVKMHLLKVVNSRKGAEVEGFVQRTACTAEMRITIFNVTHKLLHHTAFYRFLHSFSFSVMTNYT